MVTLVFSHQFIRPPTFAYGGRYTRSTYDRGPSPLSLRLPVLRPYTGSRTDNGTPVGPLPESVFRRPVVVEVRQFPSPVFSGYSKFECSAAEVASTTGRRRGRGSSGGVVWFALFIAGACPHFQSNSSQTRVVGVWGFRVVCS